MTPSFFIACYQSLIRKLEEDYWQWPLWIPVGIGIGIAFYFQWPSEPAPQTVYGGVAGILCVTLLLRYYTQFTQAAALVAILWCCFWIMLGVGAAKIRVDHVAAPSLTQEKRFVECEATIAAIVPQSKAIRLLLTEIHSDRFRSGTLPKAIRLTVRTKFIQEGVPVEPRVGDRVAFTAMLSPPPKASMPGSYDFSFVAYFQQIGAVGYSITPIEIIAHHRAPAAYWLENLRHAWNARIVDCLGPGRGHMASALMIGEYRAMDATLLDAMRGSGLSHILSVSGMHLTLVATIFFVGSRMLMALSARMTLMLPIKKIAAWIAICGSLAYLLISGLQVAAIRSFIMTCIVLTGILLDRVPHPMRAVACAAAAMLLIEPENLFGPSFQMSFAAVTALIALYPYWHRWWVRVVQPDRWWQRSVGYVIGIIISSLIAGSATAPFAIYHFGQYANYGILANVLALPITSFWIMPCVVLSFLLLPLSLESLALIPMGVGIDLVIRIAEWVSAMPGASVMVSTIAPWILGIIVLGGLWGLLWQGRWRYYGMVPIGIGMVATYFTELPVVLVDGRSGNFAVKNEQDQWVFSSRRFSPFTRDIWLKSNGQSHVKTVRDLYPHSGMIECSPGVCLYHLHDTTIALIRDTACPAPEADLRIMLTEDAELCGATETVLEDPSHSQARSEHISHQELRKMGSIALYWDHAHARIRIVSGAALIPTRAWQTLSSRG